MPCWLPHWNQEQNELKWTLKIMPQDYASKPRIMDFCEVVCWSPHFFLSFTQDDGGGGPGGGGGGGGGGAPIRGGGAWKIHYINRLVTQPGIWCRILIKYTIFVFMVLEWNSLAMEAHAGGISLKRDYFDLHLKWFPTLASVASKFHANTKNINMVY